jgi:type VI secretion system protein ImpI
VTLMLEVVSAHRASMGAHVRRCIGEAEAAEFTIGRLETCSWVFPQDYVSRVQAVIRCVNGMYFLECKGSAPLAVNDRSRPLERNRIVRISPGDRILIDDIDILVSEVEPGVLPAAAAASPLPDVPLGDVEGILDVGGSGGGGDVMELLGGGESAGVTREAERRRDQALFPEQHSALDNLMDFRAPASPTAPPEPRSGLSDDRWWEDPGSHRPGAPAPPPRAPSPAPPPAPPPASRPARPAPPRPAQRTEPLRAPSEPVRPAPARAAAPGEVTLDEVLRGAGLDPSQVRLSPELAEQLGEVLRIVVAGTMEVLKARNDIRRELRLPSTVLASTDNNPLKFSADLDDALHKLLVQRSEAYLGAVAAFREAFSDIRHHHIALLRSVGVAFDHMLRRFEPRALEEQFGARADRPGVLGKKHKPWQAYVEYYGALQGDRDHAYRKLFGEEWAKAYEQELQLQKSIERAGKERR